MSEQSRALLRNGFRVVGASTVVHRLAAATAEGTRSDEPVVRGLRRVAATQLQVRALLSSRPPLPLLLEALQRFLDTRWPDAWPPLTSLAPRGRVVPPAPLLANDEVRWESGADADRWAAVVTWRRQHSHAPWSLLHRVSLCQLAGAPVIVGVQTWLVNVGRTASAPPTALPLAAVVERAATLDLPLAAHIEPSEALRILADFDDPAAVGMFERVEGSAAVKDANGALGPREIGRNEIASLLAHVESGARALPVLVLSPRPDGTFPTAPSVVAAGLRGVVEVAVIREPRVTFHWSDALGDRHIGTYQGFGRLYYPGFTREAPDGLSRSVAPERLQSHTGRTSILLVAGRTAPVVSDPPVVAAVLAEAAAVRPRVEAPPPSVMKAVPASPSVVDTPDAPSDASSDASSNGSREVADASTPSMPTVPLSPVPWPLAPDVAPPTTPHGAPAQRRTDAAILHRLQALEGEVASLRLGLSVAQAEVESARALVRRLERRLARQMPREVAPTPTSGVDVVRERTSAGEALVAIVRDAMVRHPDALFFLPRALESAAESPFIGSAVLQAALDALADIARRRLAGRLGVPLKDACRALGLRYAGGITAHAPAKLRQQHEITHDGTLYPCYEHLRLGGGYDPAHNLRIYFSSRVDPSGRFVIGHVGRHFEVLTST